MPGDLFELDDDELGRPDQRETYLNVNDPLVDVILRGGLAIAFD